MSDFAVETNALGRVFKDGNVQALKGVSLQVPRGQVFGLLGPNGSGKTTMIRILSTTLAPTSGSATVDGFDVVKQADDVRRRIGLAGQFATVDENLTGFENLRMIGSLNHLKKSYVVARAHELLERFSLAEAGNRMLKGYSGGMRRRLDLAAALMANPPILFLDEPTTGLDPQSRQDLWTIIEQLVEEGTTVLLTTQYLEEADRLAKQLVVLDKGSIIAQGTSAELKATLGTTVLALTFETTADARRGFELVMNLTQKKANIDGTIVELTLEDGPRAAADALRRLDAENIPVAGLSLREPSLDDVFLTLTGSRPDEEVVVDTKKARKAH
jgi:daunorubicin resistance ABC transporter ATP-binding subunit